MGTDQGAPGTTFYSRYTRRNFVKGLAGAAVAAPLAGWLLVPSVGAAATRTPNRSWRYPTPTPTPKPTSTDTPTPTPAPSTTGGPIISVKSYGATGNGTTDDTRAIQAAINAGQQTANSVVSFPAGSYRISATLQVTGPVQLAGAGAGLTTVAANGTMDVFKVSGASNVHFSGLTITNSNPSAQWGDAIAVYDTTNLTVQNCTLTSIPDTAIGLTRVDGATITDCTFKTILNSGVRLENPGTGNANRNVRVLNNTFTDVARTSSAGHSAVQSHDAPGITQEYVTVQGNHVQSNRIGIGLDLVNFGVVSNNQVTGNAKVGEGIVFSGSNNQILGNTVNNAYAAGILLWGVSYRSIANNIIQGNTAWNNAEGIAVVCGDSGTVIDTLSITGNRCYSASTTHPQGYGMQSYIDGTTNFTWKNVSITNNDLRGNAVGGIYLAPPSTAQLSGNLA